MFVSLLFRWDTITNIRSDFEMAISVCAIRCQFPLSLGTFRDDMQRQDRFSSVGRTCCVHVRPLLTMRIAYVVQTADQHAIIYIFVVVELEQTYSQNTWFGEYAKLFIEFIQFSFAWNWTDLIDPIWIARTHMLQFSNYLTNVIRFIQMTGIQWIYMLWVTLYVEATSSLSPQVSYEMMRRVSMESSVEKN